MVARLHGIGTYLRNWQTAVEEILCFFAIQNFIIVKKLSVIAEFLSKKIMLSVKVYNNISAVTLVSELVSIEVFNPILYVYCFSPNCWYVLFYP